MTDELLTAVNVVIPESVSQTAPLNFSGGVVGGGPGGGGGSVAKSGTGVCSKRFFAGSRANKPQNPILVILAPIVLRKACA